jgi:hypothetical protein
MKLEGATSTRGMGLRHNMGFVCFLEGPRHSFVNGY